MWSQKKKENKINIIVKPIDPSFQSESKMLSKIRCICSAEYRIKQIFPHKSIENRLGFATFEKKNAKCIEIPFLVLSV